MVQQALSDPTPKPLTTRSLEGSLRNRFGRHGDVVGEVLPGGQEADRDAGVELQMHQRLKQGQGRSFKEVVSSYPFSGRDGTFI